MNKEPVVVICGRPNVGKSSLFNACIGRRVAIVDPTHGVTRDRVMAALDIGQRRFVLVDTGGIGLFDEIELKKEVEQQIEIALQCADLILFLVDARDGLMPADEDIARRLRGLGKPILLIANKCDGISIERELAVFYRLGMGEPLVASALSGIGIPSVREAIAERVPQIDEEGPEPSHEAPIRLAIVGKVNSGKSTFTNLVVGENRVIVSDIAGTTRDAVDVAFQHNGRRFIAIDTAGLRKRRVVEGTADFYGQGRAITAVKRADVVLLFVDASRKISQIDKGLAAAIAQATKPVVLCVTKWDLAQAEGREPAQYAPYIQQQLPLLEFAPVSFLSSHKSWNISETLDLAVQLWEQSAYRVPTGQLNRVIEDALTRQTPRGARTRVPKVLYATQTGVHPPTIVLFVNDKKLFDDEYRRYLANRLRNAFPFDEVPIRIHYRSRTQVAERPPRG